MHNGSCLCGAVTFAVAAALQPPVACHCRQCRKQSGHFFASADVPRSSLSVQQTEALTWFQSSERVRRGFCSRCGSTLFWDPIRKETISVAMGAFDTPTEVHLSLHIFVSDKGDYYDIADGLPQNQQ